MLLGLAALAAFAAAPLVDVTTLTPPVAIDIKYATTDNFMHKQLYPVARCLLRSEVAEMVLRAQAALQSQHPGYRLLMKDCYRPESIQRAMWEVVKGTPMQSYVKDPNDGTGSVHNYGAAVDLTLLGPDGKEIDMGTPYDFFGALAQPRYEDRFLKAGTLTAEQAANRHILHDAMVQGGGFRGIRNEWWHFDALQGQALRAKYTKLDVPLTP